MINYYCQKTAANLGFVLILISFVVLKVFMVMLVAISGHLMI